MTKARDRRGYGVALGLVIAFWLGIEAQRRGYVNFARQNPGDIYRLLLQHLQLVFVSGSIAIVLGLTIGIVLTRGFMRRYREMTLNALGICQTVPSLAVIAIAMTYLGIGRKTAIFALVVYSLLPIIRNTVAGIFQVDPALVDAGHGMGMTPLQVLFRVEIPNAMYIILTGIRTAVVINVGTAAMSFLVGGGGLGDLIFTGLAMVDAGIMLAGAVPTACLAIVLNWGFERLENLIISPGIPRGE
ncbi:MAG TPA: ABC transporter permease [Syntrophobacteria bacterium]|nr:ABC transporter permease [Syntrophobacteria bacterium]